MAVERKFVEEGLRRVMINEYLAKTLEKAGYGGMNINRTPLGTQITIYAERPGLVIGRGGQNIREITNTLRDIFGLYNPQIDVREVEKPELNAQVMAQRLANALERGWYFRKAGFLTLQRIMEAGAIGCEIRISGKLTGPRARTEKFVAGYVVHSGEPAEELVMEGYATAKKKLGVIGVVVRIIPPGVKLPGHFEVTETLKESSEVQEVSQEASGGEGDAGAEG